MEFLVFPVFLILENTTQEHSFARFKMYVSNNLDGHVMLGILPDTTILDSLRPKSKFLSKHGVQNLM